MEQAITFFRTIIGQNRPTYSGDNLDHAVSDNASETASNRISLNPRTVAGLLALTASVLVFINTSILLADYFTGSTSVFISRLNKVFNVDHEFNVPTFFSMLLMLFSSLLLAVITTIKYRRQAPYVWHWAILTFGFLFMAFDETAGAHEKLIEPMRAVLGGDNLGLFYFAWVVPAIALVIFLSFFFLRFWWNLPPKTRLYFLIAGILFLSGALGMELIGGRYGELHGKENLSYKLLTTVEETLEMASVVVFIRGLLGYIAENTKELVIHFGISVKQQKEGIAQVV